MQKKKRIAIICFSDFSSEPRVIRTIEALMNNYNIDVYSTGKIYSNIQSLDVHSYDRNYERKNSLSFLGRVIAFFDRTLLGYQFGSKKYFERLYWKGGRNKILSLIETKDYSLVIGHGIFTLPILANLNCPTIFNAHEYYEKEFEENVAWKKYTQPFYKHLTKHYLHKINLMFCVCESIQAEYLKTNTIKSVVITNATKFNNLKPNPVSNPIKIIHHGAALRTRELERMADMMNLMSNDYELIFMLVKSDEAYYNELKEKYGRHKLIHFIDPVSVNSIPQFCNNFDIGLFILPPVNYNWENALPNKIFEFVQSRLCLAVSPNVNMKAFVKDNGIGIVAEDYTAESMAIAINAISREQIYRYKLSADDKAFGISAEENYRIMLQKVNELIQQSCAA